VGETKPIAEYLNFFTEASTFYRNKETNLKSVHTLQIKLQTSVIMNSTVGSTLGPGALDVGSLNYFEAIKLVTALKTFYKF
jgi:hypothetical protein